MVHQVDKLMGNFAKPSVNRARVHDLATSNMQYLIEKPSHVGSATPAVYVMSWETVAAVNSRTPYATIQFPDLINYFRCSFSHIVTMQ